MEQNKVIKFSNSGYFKPWRQINTNFLINGGTWRKDYYKNSNPLAEGDSTILLEPFVNYDNLYWKPYFIIHNEFMLQLSKLYWKIYSNNPILDIDDAKNQIDSFLVKTSKISVFI